MGYWHPLNIIALQGYSWMTSSLGNMKIISDRIYRMDRIF